ncbi:MAG: AAA family ATPase, partial [Pseudomonadota bacterium]
MDPQFKTLMEQIGTVVLGKNRQIRLAMACLFASGHLLIEDLPGIGKTTLAKVLSKCLGLKFQRIQCTSDMLPGDILGVSIFDRKSSGFNFHSGPIFTQVLLADEINRATPKTQSALLEAMEERQVTIDGKTRPLPLPFYVIATQNPQEQSGMSMIAIYEPPMIAVMEPVESGQKTVLGPASNYGFSPPFKRSFFTGLE